MNYSLLIAILFELLQTRRVTANEFALQQGVSPRTVYRYVERLAPFLPLHIARGRLGGIYLADNYRLPCDFFTQEEYEALEEALALAYAQNPDPKFLEVKRKLSMARSAGRVAAPSAFDAGEVLLNPEDKYLAEKLHVLQEGLRLKRTVRLLFYYDEPIVVEPHLLLLEGEEWKLYAFCPTLRNFQSFSLSDVRGLLVTDEHFRPRNVEFNDTMYEMN